MSAQANYFALRDGIVTLTDLRRRGMRRCIQITIRSDLGNHVSLSWDEARALASAMTRWVRDQPTAKRRKTSRKAGAAEETER